MSYIADLAGPADRPVLRDDGDARLENAARRVGLDPQDVDAFSGHSMRAGSAQDLLKRGFDTTAIMRAGGWTSVTVRARSLEFAEHNVRA